MTSDSKKYPNVQALIDHATEHGYVIITKATDIEAAAKLELARISGTQDAGPVGSAGRNAFEGLRTQHIYASMNNLRVFDKFALHPSALALNGHFLDEGYLLNAFHSISICPSEAVQRLHQDDEYVTVPRPHKPFGSVRFTYKSLWLLG